MLLIIYQLLLYIDIESSTMAIGTLLWGSCGSEFIDNGNFESDAESIRVIKVEIRN